MPTTFSKWDSNRDLAHEFTRLINCFPTDSQRQDVDSTKNEILFARKRYVKE